VITARAEDWPIRGTFTISRGAKTHAQVVVCTITAKGAIGHGEAVPYARYGETVDGVLAQLHGRDWPLDLFAIQALLPPGAARNALDCALWDWRAKHEGHRVHDLLIVPPPAPLTTCFTLSLDTPEAMGRAAAEAADRPWLKLKVGADGGLAQISAVRAAAPKAKLVVDANEAWPADRLDDLLAAAAGLDVAMVEQPLPAGQDDVLAGRTPPVPLCADESCHTSTDIPRLAALYQAVNVKLDKTGGLTEALATAKAARVAGLSVMLGCMVGTSLGMAPAMYLGHLADVVDLDGPLLLARDRMPGLAYAGSVMAPPERDLWG